MTAYQHIPSSVLALEYLADVESFNSNPDAARTLHKTSSLLRNIRTAYGFAEANQYALSLFRLDKAKRESSAIRAEPKRPKLGKRNDAAYNERRMRDALLALVGRSGWTKAGIRELARQAGMPHRTARTVLERMAAEGQVELDAKWGQGKPTGAHPLLDHPAWSGHEYAQLGDRRQYPPRSEGEYAQSSNTIRT